MKHLARIVSTVVVGWSLAVGVAACGGADAPDTPTADSATPDSADATSSETVQRVTGGRCRPGPDDASMARVWNDAALEAIRLDFPAPTVHARNLFHVSAAMWDVWAAFDDEATGWFVDDVRAGSDDVAAARDEAIAFAAHRILVNRYDVSLAGPRSLLALGTTLNRVCSVVDPDAYVAENPDGAAALGLRIADEILAATADDGSLEDQGYVDPTYRPVNPPLVVAEPGTELVDPDRWQPLLLDQAVSQNGVPLPPGEQTFVGANWGAVTPFALAGEPDQDGGPTGRPIPPGVEDPGPPPRIDDPSTADEYRSQALDVLRASSRLEAGVERIDVGPGAMGDDTLGTDDGDGHDVDPTTGEPYPPNVVDAADHHRVIAEYWADGPTSETPPGHWNQLASAVSDALPDDQRRIAGEGPVVDRLEWDVKLGLALNGGLHDAAIAAWGLKAHFDSIRPISMIRWMGRNGAFDPDTNPDGLPLEDGLVELITEASSAPGERHERLADHVGEIAVRAWVGSPEDPENDVAGVDWIRAVEWVPYQRSTFVTPAFASYVSGHSTFSRAAAEVLTGFTGSEFFPGGVGTATIEQGSLLHEDGPTEDVTLTWATYYDASDEAGRSRIWGGIHIPADDLAGRRVGSAVGFGALDQALTLF